MKTWLVRSVVLAALVLVGFWLWHTFFPNPEKLIRRRLTEMAKLASCGLHEGELARPLNAQKLGSYCTPDVTVAVNIPNLRASSTGRDEIVKGALWARSNLAPIDVQFSDIVVTVAADRQSAIADLTARVRGGNDIDSIQELSFRLKKVGREWLVSRVESVKTLR